MLCVVLPVLVICISSVIFLYFLIFFFFYCFGHHRDLHSFPTRRSSDLRPRADPPVRAPCRRVGRSTRPAAASHGCDRCRRSEEHTSELQSRGHLVCRLLLEKKKRK